MKTVSPPERQKGVVLVISLLILLVMTVIGVSGMQSSQLEEKMAGHFRDSDLTFQAVEAALRVGEGIAQTQSTTTPVNSGFPAYTDSDGTCPDGAINNCTSGLCPTPDKDCTPRWEDTGFNGWVTANAVVTGGLVTTPQYFVEYLGATFPCTRAANACNAGPGTPGCNCRRYRVTARISPSNGRAAVTLQSVYATN